jgi:hypothetical protein
MSNQAQVKAIYSLLGQHGLRDEKENIVSAFTGGKTNSVRAMSFEEAKALISHLKTLDPSDKASDKMRNKIISMAHEMSWRIEGTDRIDMKHLNGWCIAHSYLKKKLDDYKHNELPKLVSQFEEVYKSYLKNL